MFTTPNDAIVFALRASHIRFHTYVDDLKPTEFTHQPLLGVNSIAWMIGHLMLTERRILGAFGVEMPPLPEGFEARFKPTRQAAGTQERLGNPLELVALYDAHRRRLIEVVAAADAATLNKPLQGMSVMVKTLGEAAAFMSVHLSMHSGQITLIRRSLGYPPVM